MTHHTTRRPLALAAALLLASTVAAASPGGPGGPKGGPGMGGPGAPGAMVEQVIEGLRDKLSLDSAQRAMFDSAHAQTIAARISSNMSSDGVEAGLSVAIETATPAARSSWSGATPQPR